MLYVSLLLQKGVPEIFLICSRLVEISPAAAGVLFFAARKVASLCLLQVLGLVRSSCCRRRAFLHNWYPWIHALGLVGSCRLP